MKNIRDNAIVKFVVALLVIGLITGFIFFLLYKPDVASYIDAFKEFVSTSHQNTYLKDIILISGVFVLSVSIVGLPILAILIFYEGMTIGFALAVFISIDFLKGLLFYTLFMLICKVVFLLIFTYFTVISLSYVLKFLDASISKNREELSRTVLREMYRFLIVFVIVLLNSTFIYLFGNTIVGMFIGLI